MKKFILLPLLLFLLISKTTFAQQDKSPVGVWTNAEKNAHFEIYKCKNDKLCGKIVWLKEPNRNGKPKVDERNPEAKLRNRPIIGLEFLKDFEYDEGGKWDDGTIYDPQSGKTYSCYMQLKGDEKMEVKGYIGFSLIGRSQIWTRVR